MHSMCRRGLDVRIHLVDEAAVGSSSRRLVPTADGAVGQVLVASRRALQHQLVDLCAGSISRSTVVIVERPGSGVSSSETLAPWLQHWGLAIEFAGSVDEAVGKLSSSSSSSSGQWRQRQQPAVAPSSSMSLLLFSASSSLDEDIRQLDVARSSAAAAAAAVAGAPPLKLLVIAQLTPLQARQRASHAAGWLAGRQVDGIDHLCAGSDADACEAQSRRDLFSDSCETCLACLPAMLP